MTALSAEVEGSDIDAQYKDYKKKIYELSNQQPLDSIEVVFNVARAQNDDEAMARIKEETTPYYEEAAAKTEAWIDSQLSNSKYELFDLYLFYNKVFAISSYDTMEDIQAVRADMMKYNDEAKASAYAKLIEQSLTMQEKSAVGAEAPEVSGEGLDGNQVKRLQTFRGLSTTLRTRVLLS